MTSPLNALNISLSSGELKNSYRIAINVKHFSLSSAPSLEIALLILYNSVECTGYEELLMFRLRRSVLMMCTRNARSVLCTRKNRVGGFLRRGNPRGI